MNKELIDLIHELLRLGRVAVDISDAHKMSEPFFTLTWNNNGTLDGEFYSYCLDLGDGGRHHTFQVEDEKTLIKVLQTFVEEAKEDIEKLKETNGDEDWAETSNEIEEQELKDMDGIERMEDEGG